MNFAPNHIYKITIKKRVVTRLADWEFSSFWDYSGKRNGDLINSELAREFGLF